MPCRRLEELARFTLGLGHIERSKFALLLRCRAVGNHVWLVMIGHWWIIWHGHWSMMVEKVGSGRVGWLLVENVWCGACRIHHPWHHPFIAGSHGKTFLSDGAMQGLARKLVGVGCK